MSKMLIGGVGSLAFLAAVGLGLAALTTNEWYIVDSGTPVKTMTMFGLFKTCVNSNDNCRDIDFDAASRGSTLCTRSKSDIEQRWNAVRALLIIGVIMAGVSFLVVVVQVRRAVASVPTSVLGVACPLLASAGFGSAIAVWMHTLEGWLYCDAKFCETLARSSPGVDCKNGVGYSLILVGVALGVSAVGLVLSACVTRLLFVADDKSQPPPQAPGGSPRSPRGAGGNQPFPQQQQQYQQHQQHQQQRGLPTQQQRDIYGQGHETQYEAAPPTNPARAAHADESVAVALPEGDWVLDHESGLYWSDKDQLYLDAATNQYFDPHSQQWYNPTTGEWYA